MKRHKRFYMLFRKEGREKVFLYDYLRRDQLHNLVRKGWEVLE